MARQTGPLKITGTINNICFYKLDKEYYARKKSTLSENRVKTSIAFKETRKYAALLAMGSVIASSIYQSIPKDKRERKKFQQLTGMAIQRLKQGLTKERTIMELREQFL